MPSSLTRFHSHALAQLCPPTCVGFRYGQPWKHLVAFLDTSFNRSASAEASTSLLLRADHHFQPVTCLYSCVQLDLTTAGAGILNQLSIVYALRPRLRSRLTLGGRAFPRKPWVYGGQEFNLSYRYSCLHSHFLTLHTRLPLCFDALRTLPYHPNTYALGSEASVYNLSPIIFGAESLDESAITHCLNDGCL